MTYQKEEDSAHKVGIEVWAGSSSSIFNTLHLLLFSSNIKNANTFGQNFPTPLAENDISGDSAYFQPHSKYLHLI